MYVVGKVLKPQGIRGEIKVKSVSPNPQRFKTLKKVFIEKETLKTYSIESVRVSDKFVFLKLLGINNREESEILRGCDILIDKSELIDLVTDEYFVHDLIGCKVITEDGLILGELIDVAQYSSNDVYVVKNDVGKEILIPAAKEVIKQVDIKNKQIKVHLLEGLLD
ncbi:MAG: 16S rRNA processing protein RimM [Calditrichia bacterium]|nr:16S rRNA processing protein RimM [Calditrichia bacterium]MCK5075971.1 16S rRNA processing protein RimM [Calditrichia bacterium]